MAFSISENIGTKKSTKSSLGKTSTSQNLSKADFDTLISSVDDVPKKANFLDRLGLLFSSLSPLQEIDKIQRGKKTGVGDYLKNIAQEAGGALFGTTQDFAQQRSSATAAENILKRGGVEKGLGRTTASIGLDIISDPANLVAAVFTGGGSILGKVAPGLVDDVGRITIGHMDDLIKTGKAANMLEAFKLISPTKKLSSSIENSLKAMTVPGIDNTDVLLKTLATDDIFRDIAHRGSKSTWLKKLPGLSEKITDVTKKVDFTGDEWTKLTKKGPGIYAKIPFTGVEKKILDLDPVYSKMSKAFDTFAPPAVRDTARGITTAVSSIFKTTTERIKPEYMRGLVSNLDNMYSAVGENSRYIASEMANFGKKLIRKGFTEEELIAALENVSGMQKAFARENVKVFPRIKELVKDSEFQDMANFYIAAMKDTPVGIKSLGIDTVDGYVLRQFKSGGKNIVMKDIAGENVSTTLKGSKNARQFKTYGEAYQYAKDNGLELSKDLPYLAGEGYKRGHQALALQSFYQRLSRSGYLKNADDVSTLMGNDYVKVKGIPELAGKVVRKEIGEVLNNYQKVLIDDDGLNSVLKIYDTIQNKFKELVTIYFPAFVARNTINNIYVNALAGNMNVKNYMKAFDILRYSQKLEKGENVVSYGKKMIDGKSVKEWYTQAIMAKVLKGGFIEKDTLGNLGIAQNLLRGGKGNPLKNAMTSANSISEGVSRLSLFIHEMNNGAKVSDAAQTVKKFLFNYDELTDVEKQVFKRMAPFYTFMRNNIRLHTDMILNSQSPLRNALKVEQGFKGENQNVLPDWTDEYMGLDIGKFINLPGGENEAWYSPGVGLSTEALNSYLGTSPVETLKNLFQQASPLIKIPIEQATGYNFFKNQKISEDTSGSSFKLAPKFIKEFLDYKEENITTKEGKQLTISSVDPQKKYWINSLIGRISSTYRDVNELFDGGQLNATELLPLLVGIRMYKFNLDEEAVRREKEKEQRVLQLLKDKGIAREYTTKFIPKSNAASAEEILSKYRTQKQ